MVHTKSDSIDELIKLVSKVSQAYFYNYLNLAGKTTVDLSAPFETKLFFTVVKQEYIQNISERKAEASRWI